MNDEVLSKFFLKYSVKISLNANKNFIDNAFFGQQMTLFNSNILFKNNQVTKKLDFVIFTKFNLPIESHGIVTE